VIVTFDVYGTLFDWERSIKGCLELLGVNHEEFFREEFRRVSGLTQYAPYSQILKQSLKSVMGARYSDEYGDALVLCFAKSPPFPDTILGLQKLKTKGHKLGVISNTEQSLLAITLCGLQNVFDWVITAEHTRFYKPNLKAFEKAYEIMRVDPKRVLHVSSYPSYDLESAQKLGVKTVLLNRYGGSWSHVVSRVDELVHILD
jgi:2-haloacid dehalogenase